MQMRFSLQRPSSAGRAAILALITVWSADASACSGPGAEAAIRLSGQIALASFTLTLLCFLCSLIVGGLRRRLGKAGLIGLGAATVLHPGILFSTLGGDCGYMARWASIGFVPLLGLGLCWMLWRGQRHRAVQTPSAA